MLGVHGWHERAVWRYRVLMMDLSLTSSTSPENIQQQARDISPARLSSYWYLKAPSKQPKRQLRTLFSIPSTDYDLIPESLQPHLYEGCDSASAS